jgi:hypothetical protein
VCEALASRIEDGRSADYYYDCLSEFYVVGDDHILRTSIAEVAAMATALSAGLQ